MIGTIVLLVAFWLLVIFALGIVIIAMIQCLIDGEYGFVVVGLLVILFVAGILLKMAGI